MRVLVVGSGGREHALAWKLSQSSIVDEVVSAPGNPGMAEVGAVYGVDSGDIDGVVELARRLEVDLAVIGPEAPLVAGVSDRLGAVGIKVFGPSGAASRIEGSKSWANDLMYRYGIPCPASETFVDSGDAVRYVRSRPAGSLVIKADGLAGGKGVVLPESVEEAEDSVRQIMELGSFGEAGATLVIEDRLSGPELSVFAFIDGDEVSGAVAARDYKRAYDGDEGLNTGGMGAYSSPGLDSEVDLEEIRIRVLQPLADALIREGCPYQGVIFAGLMITDAGAQVIEFNCRFGDPECEAIMFRMDSDLAEVCLAVAEGRLRDTEVRWNDSNSVSVAMVSGEYPEPYDTGFMIDQPLTPAADSVVFHAGTAWDSEGWLVTDGGRVLVPSAASDVSLAEARRKVYEMMIPRIGFEGARYRSDIACEG